MPAYTNQPTGGFRQTLQDLRITSIELVFPQRLKNARLVAAVTRGDEPAVHRYLEAGANPKANDYAALKLSGDRNDAGMFARIFRAIDPTFMADRNSSERQEFLDISVSARAYNGDVSSTKDLLAMGASSNVALTSAIEGRRADVVECVLSTHRTTLTQNVIDNAFAHAVLGGNQHIMNQVKPYVASFAPVEDMNIVYNLVKDARVETLRYLAKIGVKFSQLTGMPSEYYQGKGAFKGRPERQKDVETILTNAGVDVKQLGAHRPIDMVARNLAARGIIITAYDPA